jgi:hypothetical protein
MYFFFFFYRLCDEIEIGGTPGTYKKGFYNSVVYSHQANCWVKKNSGSIPSPAQSIKRSGIGPFSEFLNKASCFSHSPTRMSFNIYLSFTII